VKIRTVFDLVEDIGEGGLADEFAPDAFVSYF
jgi:hypothetical protein